MKLTSWGFLGGWRFSLWSFNFKLSYPLFQTECKSRRCIPDSVLFMPDSATAATASVELIRIMRAFALRKGKMKRPVQNCRAREAGVSPRIST